MAGSASAQLSLEAFFEKALDEFARVPARTRSFALPGCAFELAASPGLLERLSRPLGHLPSAPQPTIRLHAWDDRTCGTRMPAPPWAQARGVHTNRGDLLGYRDPRFRAAFNYSADLLTMWDERTGRGLYWTRDAARLPGYERTAPMRTLLHWVAAAHGWQLAHAAAVGRPSGGLLLAGKGGSGKSTSALACLAGGWGYASDDYCLVGPSGAHSLYSSARLLDSSRALLPAWPMGEPEDAKSPLFLQESHPGQVLQGFPIRALVIPQVTGSCRLTPLPSREGLAALALSTMAQLAQAGPEHFQRLARAVEGIPCYRLEVGPDVGQIPAALEALL